jgi:hypothetical protein
VSALLIVATVSAPSAAATPGQDGYYRTGEGIQTANHWPFTIEVFAIWHDVKQLPSTKSRKAMIELDADKRFSLRMMRNVDADRLRGGLRDGFHRNGYQESTAIEQLLSALTGTLPKGQVIWISYEASSRRTRMIVDGGATAEVDGIAFMRATWSIWFGDSKPSDLGDALINKL